ncbi:MAG: hypothetical protein JWN78_1764 [Bacteroidota bacterium]|nr:hypothetical protein [Bacteroidota bacterium]
MRKLKFLLTSLIMTVTLFTFAGGPKVAVVNGSLAPIKGKTVLVQFVYDGTSVGAFRNENDYIAKKKAEYNAKEPGRGDKWAEAWKADRAKRFEPKFFELANKYGEETQTKFVPSGDADYTMVVKTLKTEPGFNIAIARKPAVIDVDLTIKDKAGKSVARVTETNVKGNGYGGFDFDTGVRLQEAYALAGKTLGKFITKAK